VPTVYSSPATRMLHSARLKPFSQARAAPPNMTACSRRSCSPMSSHRHNGWQSSATLSGGTSSTHTTAWRPVSRSRGRVIKNTGDGILATFDGPARAIRCAASIGEAVRALGIDIRAGLHAGEVELRGDDIGGIAVHTAARVMGEAGPGEILVSSTVKDLVVGSGIEFVDRGDHELRGLDGLWRLFAHQLERSADERLG
jgi:hypothetical protein